VAQEDLKADLLAAVYRENLAVGALGIGPSDMAMGPEKLRLPRVIANLGGQLDMKGVQTGTIAQVGDAKVGVFGVVAPDMVKGLTLTDPVAAGKAAIADLKKQGAQVVVALVQAPSKRDAVKLARDIGGIDVTVAGLGALAPEPDRIDVEAEKVGDGWLVIPANRGQIVSRVDITLRGGEGPLVDAVGKGAAHARIEQLDEAAVTGAALVGRDDAVERGLLLSLTGHANRNSHRILERVS
jgi:2',3'-cyclic-nucleotide 2'-phosphodiesterase (5'-nucleotidase family)